MTSTWFLWIRREQVGHRRIHDHLSYDGSSGLLLKISEFYLTYLC